MELDFEGYSIHITKITTKPSGKSAVYLHGMCMYGDYYHNLIDFLPDDYANFYFIDMPNHGRSSGEKGFLPDSTTIVNSIDFCISTIKKEDRLDRIDLISAESMGGIFALYYLLKRDPESNNRYLIFGAPLFPNWSFFFTNLKQPESSYCALFAKDRMVLPVKTLLGEMTRNSEVYKQIKNDPLVPQFANINYLLTIHKMAREINSSFGTISKNILFFYGEEDAICNLKKIRQQNQPMKNVKTIFIPKEYHSMFWADKDTYKPPIKEWLSDCID